MEPCIYPPISKLRRQDIDLLPLRQAEKAPLSFKKDLKKTGTRLFSGEYREQAAPAYEDVSDERGCTSP